MVFGNIATFYLPITASAGSSLWGTDVRKVLDSPDATADALTKTNHGTGTGPVVRTADPFTTTTADLDQTLYGFAIAPADMGSVAGAKRFFPAGDHTLEWRASQNAATAAAPTHTLYVYRVGDAAGGRVRTLLGSASQAETIPGLSGEDTQTVTVALGEIVFEPDETIQYVWETSSAGIVISGRIITHYTGTQSSVESRVTTPGLGVLADTTGTATGSATVAGVTSTVLNTTGSATGTGSAAGVGASRADTTGSATGTGTASGQMSAVAGTTGTAAGTSTATGLMTGIGGMVGTATGVGVAQGVMGAIGGMVGAAAGTSTVTGVTGALGATTGAALGSSTATGFTSAISGTTGAATGTGTANGVGGAVIGTVGSVVIGGGCPEDWPLNDGACDITGTVYHHETGAIVPGATVWLVRDSDQFPVVSQITDIAGVYSFPRDTNDPYTYHVTVTYNDAGTLITGMSATGCTPDCGP